MRTFFGIIIAAAVIVLLWSPAMAQDSTGPKSGIDPDLPLEKPVPESPPDEEDPPEEEPPGQETPPEELPPEEVIPETPPPEFFEEPIETTEVIYVIDRTGSMTAPAKMSVEDESGNLMNNATKIDVARAELIKSINNLSENVKFAVVCYSAILGAAAQDTNFNYGTRKWDNWPPAQGEPAPYGLHVSGTSLLPAWPTSGLAKATDSNKSTAISWAQGMLANSQATGHTSIYAGMSLALKRVSPPAPGSGEEKSITTVFLLTDGAPNVLNGTCYATGIVGINGYFGTWAKECMDLTKNQILAENVHQAKIVTLGMGMDHSSPNTYVWNPGKGDYDFYPTQYNDYCRQFLTQLAQATGGHYREVSK